MSTGFELPMYFWLPSLCLTTLCYPP